MPTMSPEFDSYLKSIEAILANNQTPDSTDFFRFFSIEAQTFNKDYLNIEYYDPELIKNEELIKSEKWVSLSSVAEVLLPRSTQNSGRNLYSKYFSYPLSNDIPLSDKSTNIVLQKGDILVASIGFQKAYLVHDEPPYKDLHPSPTFFVIRPKSEVVTSYYLFLYLQSDTARKYAERHKTGVIFQRINLKDLRDFPIVLPDIATQELSHDVFEAMFVENDNKLNAINKLLFSKKDLPVKTVQHAYLLEELESVRFHKKELVSNLLKDDFKEIMRCLNVSAYKSTLILCGSILETVLLDWLSEVKEKNFFEERIDDGISKMINKLENELGKAKDQAIRINERRNLIHPRRFLQSREEINKKLCESVITDLRMVLKQRGLRA